MKITKQEPQFQPFAITIETPEEANVLWWMMHINSSEVWTGDTTISAEEFRCHGKSTIYSLIDPAAKKQMVETLRSFMPKPY